VLQFQGKKYQLFFSNNLEPFKALNYSDELFFAEFERLCDARYRVLSVIRKGWQEKYGLLDDIDELEKVFRKKLSEPGWADRILKEYEEKKAKLEATLSNLSNDNPSGDTLLTIRRHAAPLDAMSNMLHLFSSTVGGEMLPRLRRYGADSEEINRNFVFYTQPTRASRYAKVLIPEFPNRFALSEEDQALSSILRVGAYIKDDVSALLEKRGECTVPLFAGLAKRLGVSTEDFLYLATEEIGKYLRERSGLEKLIQERRVVTVIFYPGIHIEMREGANAETFLSDGGFVELPNEIVGVLKGQPASLGTVRGRAVVVKNSTDAIRLMRKGDILIAPYTAPEYLPAMKLAAGIVTETGGITSHAAIVSREFKIPCIIAVTDAMSRLQTGDIVEMNAEQGTIRIAD
jgi:phosphohistidine swiveling domain-containing protein